MASFPNAGMPGNVRKKPWHRLWFEQLEPRWALTAQIGGVVWQDVNANAVRDAGEPEAQAVVYLDLDDDGVRDNGEPTTTTASDGTYSFTVAPGSYRVRQQLPDGGVQTSPAPGPTIAIADGFNRLLSFRTVAGAVIAQTTIPTGSGGSSEVPRELDVTDDGRVVVFNGTFSPRLSIYNPVGNAWTHYTHPGWATSNNTRYGGVAYAAGYAFVTDSYFSGDDPSGVVRFDVNTGESIRISTYDPTEVVAGLDGKIYFSNQGGSLGIIDPQTGQVTGSTGFTGVSLAVPSVDAAGRIYVPYYTRGGVAVYSPEGDDLGVIPVPTSLNWSSTRDIDLAPNGQIMLTTDDGRVIISDPSRTSFTSFVAAAGRRINGAWYSGHELADGPLIVAADGTTSTANFGLFRLPPDPPAAPRLAATHNSGVTSDLKTNRNNSSLARNLAFEVEGTLPGALVEVYADGVLIGTAAATGATTLVTTDGTTPLADGARTITARQRFSGFASSVASASLALKIDATPPTVTVNPLTTDALRPRLSGTLSEPASVSVLIDGTLYVAQVQGTTWSLPEGALAADLATGPHHVTAIAVDVAENAATDATSAELTIVPPTSRIVGSLWDDVDADGVRDATETGWSGLQVYLDLNRNAAFDAGEPTTTTAQDDQSTQLDESGRYEFAQLFHGAYDVRTVLPLGIEQTTAIATAWPTADEFLVVQSPRSERLLHFGELVAASGDRFAVTSRAPASMGRQGQLIEIYRSIGGRIFHEGEIAVPVVGLYEGQISSLAIDGDSLLVGLERMTVSGREQAGMVLAYRRVEGAWLHESTLTSVDPRALNFGSGVAVYGDVAVVGAPWGSAPETATGSLHIYERTAAGWTHRQTLLNPNGSTYDVFGRNLAMSDDTIVIGSPDSNRVYLSQRIGAEWTSPQVLSFPESIPVYELGDSLAIRDDILLVGGPGHYGAQALLFRQIGNQWTFEDNIGALYSDQDFGDGVALVQGHAVVSEPFFDGPTTWSGILQVFDNYGGQWQESHRILPDANGQIFFGKIMAGLDDAVLVGLSGDPTSALGAGSVRVIRPQHSAGAVSASAPLSGVVQAADVGVTRRPAAPRLIAAHDSGLANDDGVTSRNNASHTARLTFHVEGVPTGGHVELWIDGRLAATAIANSTGAALTTDGVTALHEGPHAVRALLRHPDGSASLASEAAAIVVDSRNPQVQFDPLTTAAASPQLELSAGPDVASIELTVGSQTVQAESIAGSWIVRAGALVPLAPGAYEIKLRAVDVAGNSQQSIIPGGVTIAPPGVIEGSLFQDLDGDRRRDANEPGFAEIVVFLDLDGDGRRDESEPWQNTDASGGYAFGNLVEGGYVVGIEPPHGFEAATPITEYGAWRSATQVDSLSLLQADAYDSLGGVIAADGNVMALSATFYSAFINRGAAAIFERDDAASPWRQARIIDATDVDVAYAPTSRFGSTVAVGDGFVVFGAPDDRHAGESGGSLFIFERDVVDGAWKQSAKLVPPQDEFGAYLGTAIAADGNLIAAGAAVSVNSVPRGRVSIYEKSPTAPNGWRRAADIGSPASGNTGDFGYVVDLDGDRLIVGAPGEGGVFGGAAYLYRRSATNPDSWILEQQFRSSAAVPRSQYAVEADLDGDLLALRSATVVDLYDLSGAAPRLIKSLPSSAYAGAAGGAINAVSLSGRVVALLDGASPAHNEIWIRDTASLAGDWTLVNKLPTTGYGPVVSGDQLFVARSGSNDVPAYAGQVLVFEPASGGANRRLELVPGEQARDIAFALVAVDGYSLEGDFNGDRSVDGTDFLIWQRGLGLSSGATRFQGDANGDGKVDRDDLALWQVQFGDFIPATPAGEAAAAIAETPAIALGQLASTGSGESGTFDAVDAAIHSARADEPLVDWRRDATVSSLVLLRSETTVGRPFATVKRPLTHPADGQRAATVDEGAFPAHPSKHFPNLRLVETESNTDVDKDLPAGIPWKRVSEFGNSRRSHLRR